MTVNRQAPSAAAFANILLLSEKSAVSFPELHTLADRCTILVGAALADGKGDLRITAWAARLKLPIGTLRRFIHEFARLGFVEAEGDLGHDRVRISTETFHRLSRR